MRFARLPEQRHGLRLAAVFAAERSETAIYSRLPCISIHPTHVRLGPPGETFCERTDAGFGHEVTYDLIDPAHPATVTIELGDDGYLNDPEVPGVEIMPLTPFSFMRR